jgi:NAD+ kinase
MRIFVLGNAHRSGVQEEADRLLPFLAQFAEIVVVDLEQQRDLSELRAEVALVLGGDGAILRAARQMGYQQTPVLGVNLGKLGFLADLSPDEVRHCFPRVVEGSYRITRHLMFECFIESATGQQKILGLNEVFIHTGPTFHIVELDLNVDGETVTRFSGDGLILSTPIGSTAHSLSAGGPILGQELSAFVITPLCPHALTNRPVVESSDKVYTIVPRTNWRDCVLMVDGQEPIPLSGCERVVVRRAPVTFGLVKVPGRTYYQTLRDKLHWGTQPNYRTEPRLIS